MPLLGCRPAASTVDAIEGGFNGISHERGHALRDGGAGAGRSWPAPSVTHTTRVVIAGGGVAGLAAARALRLKGMDDFALLELEDLAGGNSRGGVVNGLSCPLGAHYLPVPGDHAPEVQDLLEEFGLRRRVAGRWEYDERHLCHSPQERLFFNGAWQSGLLPVQGVGAGTRAQYQQFAALVASAQKAAVWAIPSSKTPLALMQRALTAITFVAYLDQNRLTDPHLRWYLDYCCRDDYGAGIHTVSAWAGIHYFASRHGFHAPAGDTGRDDAETEPGGLLTWPEGNAWLTRRLAAPLGERLQTGWVVFRIAETRQGVALDAYHPVTRVTHRWRAERCINALPVFVAARVVDNPPGFLRDAAAQIRYAPWLVANIHIRAPLQDRPGPAPAWDNLIHSDSDSLAGRGPYGAGLGYVDAQHQSLLPVPGATVLTHYRALGDVPDGRQRLMDTPWATWRDVVLADLGRAHPDIASKTTRIDITRYGHAMAVPAPVLGGQNGHWPSWRLHRQLSKTEQNKLATQRQLFAHADWAGYSVFEEAFYLGHSAGQLA